jgi:ABC-type uncharacterized transport system ATPase subunit
VIKPGRSDRFRHQKTITRGDLRRDLHTDLVKGYPPAETKLGQAQCVQEAHGNGQTVFLSSHILSEVEALCDRVGILREGRLVEIGTLQAMRHLSTVTVEAVFAVTPPDVSRVAGVKRAAVNGRHLRLEVQGPMEPLVDALAGTGLLELLSREPSLEELFLAHYGPDGAAPVPAVSPAVLTVGGRSR